MNQPDDAGSICLSYISGISTNSASENEKEMIDVALKIHFLLQPHETSIVERHTSCLAGRSKDRPGLLGLCGQLVEFSCLPFVTLSTLILHTKDLKHTIRRRSEPASSRIAALKAICGLTVEDPYARKILGEHEKSRHCLLGLTQALAKEGPEEDTHSLALIALDAIENDKVDEYWSNVITEPVHEEMLQQLIGRAPLVPNDSVAELARYETLREDKRISSQ